MGIESWGGLPRNAGVIAKVRCERDLEVALWVERLPRGFLEA